MHHGQAENPVVDQRTRWTGRDEKYDVGRGPEMNGSARKVSAIGHSTLAEIFDQIQVDIDGLNEELDAMQSALAPVLDDSPSATVDSEVRSAHECSPVTRKAREFSDALGRLRLRMNRTLASLRLA